MICGFSGNLSDVYLFTRQVGVGGVAHWLAYHFRTRF